MQWTTKMRDGKWVVVPGGPHTYAKAHNLAESYTVAGLTPSASQLAKLAKTYSAPIQNKKTSMVTCEKCWDDARGSSKTYHYLLSIRNGNYERKCTVEEQAGSKAKQCPDCDRLTLHQQTMECTNCEYCDPLTKELAGCGIRLFSRVRRSDKPNALMGTHCWLWNGTKINGHGQITVDGKSVAVHRYVYGRLVKRLTPKNFLVHKCKEALCVNPGHVEVITRAEVNRRSRSGRSAKASSAKKGMAARTHCPQGHEYSEENTVRNNRGHRTCRTCARNSSRLSYQRLHGKQPKENAETAFVKEELEALRVQYAEMESRIRELDSRTHGSVMIGGSGSPQA